METRKRNKRRISYSSSEHSDLEDLPRQSTRTVSRQIRDESLDNDSNMSSELSDAPSLRAADIDDEEDMDEEDPSDEDEEAIIDSIMQPQIDTSKKTARQKAKETGAADHLEFLPIDRNSKIKPILTEEELALRKSENARKRKNQTEKKLDEEKQETINRLLNKQAGKRKGAVKQLTVADAAGLEEAEEAAAKEPRKVRPLPIGMIRYVNSKQGAFVGLPQELVGHVATRSLFGE